MKKLSLYLFLILLICFNSEIKAETLKVIDGDTIVLNGEKIRFSGIDTPEMKQTCNIDDLEIFCGRLAKIILIEKIGNETPSCIREKKLDKYKRILAECFVNGDSFSRYMVRNGYAFDYTRYSKKKYAKDEEYAKTNKLGIWTMKFEYPWEWRKKIREQNK